VEPADLEDGLQYLKCLVDRKLLRANDCHRAGEGGVRDDLPVGGHGEKLEDTVDVRAAKVHGYQPAGSRHIAAPVAAPVSSIRAKPEPSVRTGAWRRRSWRSLPESCPS